jgi:hypothetical protein
MPRANTSENRQDRQHCSQGPEKKAEKVYPRLILIMRHNRSAFRTSSLVYQINRPNERTFNHPFPGAFGPHMRSTPPGGTMNNTVKALLLAAAGTGLMSGTATVQPVTIPTQGGRTVSASRLGELPMTLGQTAKHDCKGMNSCKGQGGCSTGDMGCKAKNSCKGKGGCKTT